MFLVHDVNDLNFIKKRDNNNIFKQDLWKLSTNKYGLYGSILDGLSFGHNHDTTENQGFTYESENGDDDEKMVVEEKQDWQNTFGQPPADAIGMDMDVSDSDDGQPPYIDNGLSQNQQNQNINLIDASGNGHINLLKQQIEDLTKENSSLSKQNDALLNANINLNEQNKSNLAQIENLQFINQGHSNNINELNTEVEKQKQFNRDKEQDQVTMENTINDLNQKNDKLLKENDTLDVDNQMLQKELADLRANKNNFEETIKQMQNKHLIEVKELHKQYQNGTITKEYFNKQKKIHDNKFYVMEKELKNQITNLTTDKDRLTTDYANAKQQIDKLTAKLDKLSKVNDENVNLKNKLLNVNSGYSGANGLYSDLKEQLSDKQRQIDKLQQSSDTFQSQYQQIQNTLMSTNKKNRNLKTDVINLNDKISKLFDDLKQSRQNNQNNMNLAQDKHRQFMNLQQEYNILKNEFDNLNNKLKENNDDDMGDDEKTQLLMQLGELKRLYQKLDEQHKNQTRELKSKEESYTLLNRDYSNLQTQSNNTLNDEIQKRKQKEQSYDDLNRQYRTLQNERDTLKGKLDVSQTLVKSFKQRKKDTEEQSADMQDKYQKLEDKYDTQSTNYQTLLDKNQHLQNELAIAQSNYENQKTLYNQSNYTAEQSQIRINELLNTNQQLLNDLNTIKTNNIDPDNRQQVLDFLNQSVMPTLERENNLYQIHHIKQMKNEYDKKLKNLRKSRQIDKPPREDDDGKRNKKNTIPVSNIDPNKNKNQNNNNNNMPHLDLGLNFADPPRFGAPHLPIDVPEHSPYDVNNNDTKMKSDTKSKNNKKHKKHKQQSGDNIFNKNRPPLKDRLPPPHQPIGIPNRGRASNITIHQHGSYNRQPPQYNPNQKNRRNSAPANRIPNLQADLSTFTGYLHKHPNPIAQLKVEQALTKTDLSNFTPSQQQFYKQAFPNKK